MTHDFFISYIHCAHKSDALELHSILTSRNYNVWLDQYKIPQCKTIPDHELETILVKAVQISKFLIFFGRQKLAVAIAYSEPLDDSEEPVEVEVPIPFDVTNSPWQIVERESAGRIIDIHPLTMEIQYGNPKTTENPWCHEKSYIFSDLSDAAYKIEELSKILPKSYHIGKKIRPKKS